MLLHFYEPAPARGGADAAGLARRQQPLLRRRARGTTSLADRRAVAAAALAVWAARGAAVGPAVGAPLSCILLNQTTRRQVDPVLCRLLREWPDAAAAAAAAAAAVEAGVRPLGLHRRRSRTIIAFSKAFLEDSWKTAGDLPGVGAYGAAAEAIFCRGDQSTISCDHALALYLRWWRARAGGGGARDVARVCLT